MNEAFFLERSFEPSVGLYRIELVMFDITTD